MPIVGFKDSTGVDLTFDDVRAGKGVFLTRRGHEAPRAMLRGLTKFYRAHDHYGDPDTVSVTTIIAPVQKTRLMQRHDIYVEWDDNLWAAYGSIEHGFFEAGAAESDLVEHKLVIERDGFKIGGTFDLLELLRSTYENRGGEPRWTGGVYQGRDYKITSAYGTKGVVVAEREHPDRGVYREKPDYFWQGNVYHAMVMDPDVKHVVEVKDAWGNVISRVVEPWPYAGKVRIDNWAMVNVVRDYNERQHGAYIGSVEVLDIPLLEIERVENYLRQRLALYAASELADDEGLPECSPEETWHGRRCAKYCAALPFCWQANPNPQTWPDA